MTISTKEQRWSIRLQDARKDIAPLLTERIYSPQGLEHLLTENRKDWRCPRTLHLEFFANYLIKTKLLKHFEFTQEAGSSSADYPTELIVYGKLNVTVPEIALVTRTGSYLSHLSAAYIHGITELVPRVFYANKEQSKKPKQRSRTLKQEAVDNAFSKPARKTGWNYKNSDAQIVLLAGQFTDRLDVLDFEAPDGNTYPATSLERTLIDCTVRPTQAGGIHELLSMYEAARERLSLRRLKKMLDELDFIYPYRQAVGFLLERAGYPPARLKAFEEPTFNINFYLDYAMAETEFSDRWRIYHPKNF